MSPRITLNRVGNSSRLDDRKNLPSRVIRCSSGSGTPLRDSSSRIVRNLNIQNGTSCQPGRCWAKTTGRPSVTSTLTPVAIIIGLSAMRSALAIVMSKSRFNLAGLWNFEHQASSSSNSTTNASASLSRSNSLSASRRALNPIFLRSSGWSAR